MTDKPLYQRIIKKAVKIQLVPVFLIHVEGAFYLCVGISQLYGKVCITFHRHPFRTVEVEQQEYFSQPSEKKASTASYQPKTPR